MGDRYGVFRTIPAWDIASEGVLQEKVMATFDDVVKSSFHHPYHIREIEEMDLSLKDWRLPADTQSLWSGTPWVGHLLSEHEALCIYGVVSVTEGLSVRKLIFGKGSPIMGMIIGRQDLTALKAFQTAIDAVRDCKDQEWLIETFGRSIFNLRMQGYFQEPYIFRPDDAVNIGVIYLPGADPGELKLMGYIAETVGKSIA